MKPRGTRSERRCPALLVLLNLLILAGGAAAVEIEPGRTYSGGTALEAGEFGLAFTVPSGWQGSLAPGSEIFLMRSEADPNALILGMGEEMTAQEIAAAMKEPLNLEGLYLQPTGATEQRGQVLTGSYSVGGRPDLGAYIEAVPGSHGVSVAYVLLAAPAALESHRPAMRSLADSTRLTSRGVTDGGSGSAGGAGGGSASGDQQTWQEYLRGKYIVRYYTASGFTDEEHLWLCSDGSFARRGASGGFGGGASGAFQSDGRGRWSATGAGAQGTLILQYGDGSSARYQLFWDYGKNELYLDGKRWLHGDNEVCR